MKKSYNKAFTLVELLAVIVILAIILVIAVPKIMDVISSSKKSTLETSVKMIASSAEKTKMQNTVLGKEDATITCDSVAKLSSSDYANCTIKFDGNTAKVTVKGKGKFEGLSVCGGTKNSATAQAEECLDTLVTHIQELYQTSASSNGLIKDNTTDKNIRFSGDNNSVKNYVEFGNDNEVWRIIGIFSVNTDNGSENLVKLVKEESIQDVPWDFSDSSINNGWGINQWGESGDYAGSQLMQHLNNIENINQVGYEFGKIIYPSKIAAEAPSFSTFPDIEFSISANYAKMIENAWWNTGAINWDNVFDSEFNLKRELLYNSERGELTGKICDTSGGGCNDTVVRTTSWKGKIALPYTSDWAYASTNSNCGINMNSQDENYIYYCRDNNWMHKNEDTWMLSPMANTDLANRVSFVYGDGMVFDFYAFYSAAVRPAIYLKSNVQINSGTGAQNDPYILKIE